VSVYSYTSHQVQKRSFPHVFLVCLRARVLTAPHSIGRALLRAHARLPATFLFTIPARVVPPSADSLSMIYIQRSQVQRLLYQVQPAAFKSAWKITAFHEKKNCQKLLHTTLQHRPLEVNVFFSLACAWAKYKHQNMYVGKY